jgi:hypothetical protein
MPSPAVKRQRSLSKYRNYPYFGLMNTSTGLFRELLREGEKKYEAFYAAQQLTRASYPSYRDWGAFYMTSKYE